MKAGELCREFKGFALKGNVIDLAVAADDAGFVAKSVEMFTAYHKGPDATTYLSLRWSGDGK